MSGQTKILIRGGQVYDHDGDVHRPAVADILIEGDTIAAIGPGLQGDGHQVIDAAGKLIIPGCVSHSTNVVEHPELVAQRIERFAGLVGKENVIASTDCGLGGRIHPDIAWAKLAALTEGARIASQRLY